MRKRKRKEKATVPPRTTTTEKKIYENFVVHKDCIHEIKLKIERSLLANVCCVFV